MVYINLRLNVADFDNWFAGFKSFEAYRKAAGSTGLNQVYHDLADPRDVTLILEWEDAQKAQAVLDNPQTKANMDSAGVTGRPTLLAIQTKV